MNLILSDENSADNKQVHNKKMDKEKKTTAPPEIGPYVFPAVLAAFGLWCLYDGFLSTNPDMQDYLLFNKIAGIVLVLWAIVDFYRTRKQENKSDAKKEE